MQHLMTVPRFAADIGITAADVSAMSGEMFADSRALHSTYRDRDGRAVGVERMSGPGSFTFTGVQALYSAPRGQRRPRILLTAGPMEALCASAAEGARDDTIYAAVPGRALPRTADALRGLILQTGATLVSMSFPAGDAGLALSDAVWDVLHPLYKDTLSIDDFPPAGGRWSIALRLIRATGRAE